MNSNSLKIELHGGGQRSKWTEVGTAPTVERATKQMKAMMARARQGGVRVKNPQGIIVQAMWLRHAPGARPQPIKFCIGCGCDDFHACIDPATGAGCHWILEDLTTPHGVCSCCVGAAERFVSGDRQVPE